MKTILNLMKLESKENLSAKNFVTCRLNYLFYSAGERRTQQSDDDEPLHSDGRVGRGRAQPLCWAARQHGSQLKRRHDPRHVVQPLYAGWLYATSTRHDGTGIAEGRNGLGAH